MEGVIGSVDVLDFGRGSTGARRWLSDRRAFGCSPGQRDGWLFSTHGSRRSRGFLPGVPSPRTMVAVGVWEDEASVEQFRTSALAARWRAHAHHWWSVTLEPIRTVGSMYGRDPLAGTSGSGGAVGDRPVTVITFARVPMRWLPTFFLNQRRVLHQLLRTPGLVTTVATGNVVLGGGVTLSVWESTAAMRGFAYAEASSPHRAAMSGLRQQGWFSESYFARLVTRSVEGTLDAAGLMDSRGLAALANRLSE